MRTQILGVVFIACHAGLCSAFGSWEVAQHALESAAHPVETYADLQRIPALESLLQGTNKAVFVVMTCQPKAPLVALAGFLILRERYSPADAYAAAFRLVLCFERPASPLLVPVFKYLEGQPQQEVFDSVFEIYGQTIPHNENISAILVGQLPYESLKSWFANHDATKLLPDCRGLLLDRLLREAKNRGETVSSKMTQALIDAQRVPGFCQLAYLLHSDPKADGYADVLKEALADTGLETIQVLVLFSNRRDSLRPMVNLGEMALSPERKKLIEKAMQTPPSKW